MIPSYFYRFYSDDSYSDLLAALGPLCMRLANRLGGVRAAGLVTAGTVLIAYLFRPQGPGEQPGWRGSTKSTSPREVSDVAQLRPNNLIMEPSAEPIERTLEAVMKDNDDFYARETAGGHSPAPVSPQAGVPCVCAQSNQYTSTPSRPLVCISVS